MVEKYPCLQRGWKSDDNWSAFKDSFSRRVRYLRYSESGKLSELQNRKKLGDHFGKKQILVCRKNETAVKTSVTDVGDSRKTPPLQLKPFELIIDDSVNGVRLKSEEEFNEMLNLINKHHHRYILATNAKVKETNFTCAKVGLQVIFENLKVYFVTVGNLKSILEKMPCLRNGNLWIYLWSLLMNDSADLKKLNTAFSKFEQVIGVLMETKNPTMTAIENFLYEETKISKGAGTKTKSVIEIDNDDHFDHYDKYLSTATTEAMKVVGFRRGDGSTKEDSFHAIYVVGHWESIYIPDNSLKMAFPLFSTYYIMSLEYPKIYSQVLGFLQTYGFEISQYKLLKSAGYLHLCSKY